MQENSIMKTVFISFVLALAIGTVPASGMTGKVTRVIDGNTLEFTSSDGDLFTIVLDGIDCPELSQAYGQEAKLCLEKLALGKKADVTLRKKIGKGVSTADVLIEGKRDPRVQLLKDGLAWVVENNADPSFEAYCLQSKTKKKGLWNEAEPTPPWVHRHEQTMQAAKEL